jgi:nucleoside-diphosphate-sugar epimerase
MRIFLSGATGQIGSAVLDALVRGGHDVTALVRTREKAAAVSGRGAQALVGDLKDGSSRPGFGYDVYVHAAFNRAAIVETDAAAIEVIGGAARKVGAAFIYTSGLWVLGPSASPAAEDAPLDPPAIAAWRPAHEQRVLALAGDGVRAVVVRPGVVYGGARGLVADMIRDAQNGLMRVVGDGTNRWALVYDRDLADAYVRLVETPDAAGIYHANDEADERVNDLVDAIAGQKAMRPDVRHVPLAEARTKLGAMADALALDQVVRSPRLRALGWSPAIRSVARNTARLFEEWRRVA